MLHIPFLDSSALKVDPKDCKRQIPSNISGVEMVQTDYSAHCGSRLKSPVKIKGIMNDIRVLFTENLTAIAGGVSSQDFS